jgi:hypothetical protein
MVSRGRMRNVHARKKRAGLFLNEPPDPCTPCTNDIIRIIRVHPRPLPFSTLVSNPGGCCVRTRCGANYPICVLLGSTYPRPHPRHYLISPTLASAPSTGGGGGKMAEKIMSSSWRGKTCFTSVAQRPMMPSAERLADSLVSRDRDDIRSTQGKASVPVADSPKKAQRPLHDPSGAAGRGQELDWVGAGRI